MWGDSAASRIVAAAVVLLGVGGVLLGAGGLYLTLTASDTPPERGADVLGAFGCEPADRDVRSVPDVSYGVETVVTSGKEIESVETSVSAAGPRVNLTVGGELLGASASRFAGGPDDSPNVSRRGEVIVVTDPERAPFRLWIDAVDDEGTVTRTEIDVCPPARSG